jgi:hypothetical protein
MNGTAIDLRIIMQRHYRFKVFSDKRCNGMSETETNKHNATTNHASITVPEFKATTDVMVT